MYVQYKSWRDVKDDAECAGNGKVMYYKAPSRLTPGACRGSSYL